MIKMEELFKNNKKMLIPIFIVILLILAMLQTTTLWYTNLANGGSFFNKNGNATNYAMKNDFVKPFRILTTSNGEKFSGIYSTQLGESITQLGEDILQKVFENGEFTVIEDIEDDIFIKNTSVIYEYKYFILGSQLAESLNIKSNNWNRIEKFDLIIFSEGDEEFIEVDFVDREEGIYTRYILDNKSELVFLKNEISTVNTDIQYSINFDELSPIEKYTIIPNWKNNNYLYNEIQAINPYTNDYGEVTIKNVEESINLFFENPRNKQFSTKDNYLIFSDANTNVKYYDISNYNIGLIEYSYYNYGSKNINNSIIDEYTVARSMIEKDTILSNDYYLSNYTFDEEEIIFYFDLVINNIPIYFSDDYNELLGTTAAIEITVKNGVVTKYKKIASNYSYTEEKRNAKVEINNVITKFFPDEELNEIKHITLAYKLDTEKTHGLHWFVEAYNSVFSYTTEGE